MASRYSGPRSGLLTLYLPCNWLTSRSLSDRTSTEPAPIVLASSSARSSARYSATLLVNSPMYSPISLRTLPFASLITMPIAEGPGLPRDAPSTIRTRCLLDGDIEDAAAVFAGANLVPFPRRVEHSLRDRHVAGIADRTVHRRHGHAVLPAAQPLVSAQEIGIYLCRQRPPLPARRLQFRRQVAKPRLTGLQLGASSLLGGTRLLDLSAHGRAVIQRGERRLQPGYLRIHELKFIQLADTRHLQHVRVCG